MAIITLQEVLQAVRRDPLALLTSRHLSSLHVLLTGRQVALHRLGLDDWNAVPLVERVEQYYGVQTTPWRAWVDIVEFFARDEWDAFEQFLKLACGWDDPVPPSPSPSATPAPIASLLEEIARRPGMFLGAPSNSRLADFLRGYMTTLEPSDDLSEVERFLAKLPALCGDDSHRPWFRVLRFRVGNEEQSFDEFFRLWRQNVATQAGRPK